MPQRWRAEARLACTPLPVIQLAFFKFIIDAHPEVLENNVGSIIWRELNGNVKIM